jgi:hypothetical protein
MFAYHKVDRVVLLFLWELRDGEFEVYTSRRQGEVFNEVIYEIARGDARSASERFFHLRQGARLLCPFQVLCRQGLESIL